jgi:hypothetical protein
MNTGYEVHHYAVFSMIYLSLLGQNILNTLLKSPQSMPLLQSERPSFTPIWYNWKN